MHLPLDSSDPLQGNWSATRWHYSGAGPELKVDIVCDLGASVTLSLGDDAYVLTCDVPGRRATEGGAFAVHGDTLELHPHDQSPTQSLKWRLVDDTLTLRAERTTCDFDDRHRNAPASLVAVLVRC